VNRDPVPDFVENAVEEIDEWLRVLKDEVARREAARAALTGGAAGSGGGYAMESGGCSRGRRTGGMGRADARRPRRCLETRASQALALIREQPGITIPEIAKAMKIQPNYLYRVLPRLASAGQLKRDGQGWHPASSSTPRRAEPATAVPGRKRTRAAQALPTGSATRAARTRRSGASTSVTSSRTAPGATRASVLAALAGGEAVTASQVATRAGLARPTVSTTLSKLGRTGEVQKAERGYRLISAV
jgi:DNA-binding MarR family transcriptional regulator